MAKGYSTTELDDAQSYFGLAFPPDFIALLLEKREFTAGAYDWTHGRANISRAIAWPLEGLLFDLEENDLWLDAWGDRPDSAASRETALREIYARAPRLIPLVSHRYLPERPSGVGNPVLSVYQSDIIYYGANLRDWILREANGWHSAPWPEIEIRIPFWADLIDANL